MIRKPAIIVTGVVLGLFIVAGVLWIPGYDRAGVHPALLAIEEPLQSARGYYYFDGGSIGLELVDARGQPVAVALPVKRVGKDVTYPNLLVGTTHSSRPGGVSYPCSEDSRRFIAMLIDKYADEGIDRGFCLQHLRNAPLDVLRRIWYIHTQMD